MSSGSHVPATPGLSLPSTLGLVLLPSRGQECTGVHRSTREHTEVCGSTQTACSKHHQAAGPEPSGCCRILILLLQARPHSPGTAAPQHCSQDHKAHCSKPETFLISVINVRVPSWPGFWLTFISRDVNNKNDSTRG